jgi:plasmid stabilization system protein ParE
VQARLSVQAEVDVASIALDLFERSAADAVAFYARVDEVLELLSDFPAIGRPKPDLGEGVRLFIIDRRWAMLYSVDDGDCTVLRVVPASGRLLSPQ